MLNYSKTKMIVIFYFSRDNLHFNRNNMYISQSDDNKFNYHFLIRFIQDTLYNRYQSIISHGKRGVYFTG